MIKLVKNSQGEVVAFGGHKGYEPTIPEGCTLELVESYTPQPTIADLTENVRVALQSAIDEKAKSFGFSDGNALMLYAGKDNPFRALADVFFLWEANVWAEAGAYKAEVIAGTKPMLTPDEAVAMMPTYPA